MGFKRPFEDEKFHELPLKHSRQLGYTDKLNQFEEVGPRDAVFQKPVATGKYHVVNNLFMGFNLVFIKDKVPYVICCSLLINRTIVDEGNLYKTQGGESSDGEMYAEESSFVLPGHHDMDDTFTWVTKGCGGRDPTHSPHSVKYFELEIPPRVFAPVETFYSFLLDQPARKQVPIGPGHQAEIPEWEGSQNKTLEPSGMMVQDHIIVCAVGEKLPGTCVTPMPDLNTVEHMDDIVGEGRKFCVCRDRGSIRCVQQHIKEAREKIVKMLGYETFKDLGFCDMGEEVEGNWSDEDAQLFHEVVYSNPVTLGRNFWQHLAAAFFSRTKQEIVSYYFNVFVLRRRAIQNRTLMLDIDSDDDEWHGCYGGSSRPHYVEEYEEDSALESPIQQGTEKVYPLHHEEGEEDASNSGDGDAFVDSREDGTGICDDEHKIYSTIEDMGRISGSNGERVNVEDDSCTSFELAHDAVNCAKNDEIGLGEHHKKLKKCNDPMAAKVWDASMCRNVSTNGKDLQPTGSIMEEIYGYGSWENKARNK